MKNNITIGIIGGKGKMGSYFTNFFKTFGYKILISDINTKLTNKKLAEKSDVIIISVPIDKTINVIKEILPFLKKESLLMDLTSIKVEPVKEMLKSKSAVIGGHPIFGPFNGMKNQIFVLCPVRPKKWLPWIKKIIKEGEGIIKILNPGEHDKLMAVVQVLTHFTDISLAKALKNLGIPIDEFLKCQSPSYRLKLDMTGRILAQEANLYGNILLSNPDRTKVMKSYLKAATELMEIADKKKFDSFIKYFNESAKYLGNFKETALRESNYLIDILNSQIQFNQSASKPNKSDLAVLGPENSYTDKAANYYLKCKKFYCQTISEIFDRVKKGELHEGIIPVENILIGPVRETIDNLFESGLRIKKELILPINLCLAGIKDIGLSKIKFILSKDVAFSECSNFLREKLPKAQLISTESTTFAVQKLIRENLSDSAVICDLSIAKKNNLKILKKNLSNINVNKTKFIIIGKNKKQNFLNKKLITSIAFYFSSDRPGNLSSILNDFAAAKINLTKLLTIPSQKSFGDYIFFIDFKGSLKDKNIKSVLKKIEKKVAKMKLFGSYESIEV